MKKKLFAILVAAGILASQAALAAEFLAPSRQDNGNVTIAGAETHRNLYTAGANVTLNGPVTGDLYVAGSSVTVNGNVERNLTAAGGTVNVNGTVGGNAHVAGGTVLIGSPLSGDLLVAGGNVTVAEKASVAGDIVVAGGNVTLDGPVAANVRVTGGNVTINGRVAGNVYAKTTEQLTFGSSSEVVGKVQLKSPKEAVIKQGAKVSSVDYTRIQVQNRGAKKYFTFSWLISIIAWFIVGWLLVRFARWFAVGSSDRLMHSFWPSLGIGLLFLIVTPVIGVLLFVTVVGYYLAILLFLFYAFVLMISSVAAAIFLGSWLWGLVYKGQTARFDWLTVLVGVIVIKLVSLIPVVGWLAVFILFLAALGSVARTLFGHFRRGEDRPIVTPPPPQQVA